MEMLTLSDLYRDDVPLDTVFIPMYPYTSGNPVDMAKVPDVFNSTSKYRFHDSLARPEDIKYKSTFDVWKRFIISGDKLNVYALFHPPKELVQHWEEKLGNQLTWKRGEPGVGKKCIVMFPMDNLPPEQHLIDPDVLYRAFDKTFIPEIPCPQPQVLGVYHSKSRKCYQNMPGRDGRKIGVLSGDGVEDWLPCVVKSSHSDAGNGTFLVHNMDQYTAAIKLIQQAEPRSNILVTKLVNNIQREVCCHMYISKGGELKIVGINDQLISNGLYKGAEMDMREEAQCDLRQLVTPPLTKVKDSMRKLGFWGVCSVDILIDDKDELYIIDINARVGFGLILSVLRPVMVGKGWTKALLPTEIKYEGSFKHLLARINALTGGEMLVCSYIEQTNGDNLAQVITFSDTIQQCKQLINDVF